MMKRLALTASIGMKTFLNLPVLTYLLLAFASQCFAMRDIMMLSRERAEKEYGIQIGSRLYGSNQFTIWVEFKPNDKLGKFMDASLNIKDGDKTLVHATLQPESSPEKIRVSFTTDPEFVASSRLEILTSHGGLSMTVFYLNMKDFINATEPSHTTRDFALTLEPVSPQIRAGTVPAFRLTLTNISDHTCRILNPSRRRWDLQYSYYALVLWKDGQELPRAISDPLPVTPADWLEVAPEETRTFLFNRFPQDLKSLRPGSYEASIRFWRDPYTSSTNAYDSPRVVFKVIE